jgi:hypothetical protein
MLSTEFFIALFILSLFVASCSCIGYFLYLTLKEPNKYQEEEPRVKQKPKLKLIKGSK